MDIKSRKIAGTLVAVALRPLIGDAAEGLGKAIKKGPVDSLSRLQLVMAESQEKAWRSLELGLRGSKWWSKASDLLSGDREMSRVQKHVEQFVGLLEQRDVDNPESPIRQKEFRVGCLEELTRARKAGLIPGAPLGAESFADELSAFPAISAQKDASKPDLATFKFLSIDLEQRGYSRLASYVEYSPGKDGPLLMTAVQHFFRRAIESDPNLVELIQMQRLEQQESQLSLALDTLNDGFQALGDQLSSLFDELSNKISEVHEDVRIIDNKLDQIRLAEAERSAREQLDRQLMMTMLQEMAKQIQQLTGKTVPTLQASDLQQEVKAEELRSMAAEVIEGRSNSGGENEAEVLKLRELAVRYDKTRERVFGNLATSVATRVPGTAATASEGANKVFNVARRGLGRKLVQTSKVSATVRVQIREEMNASSVLVSDVQGNLIRTLLLPPNRTIRFELPPGRYRLRLKEFDMHYFDIELVEVPIEDNWIVP